MFCINCLIKVSILFDFLYVLILLQNTSSQLCFNVKKQKHQSHKFELLIFVAFLFLLDSHCDADLCQTLQLLEASIVITGVSKLSAFTVIITSVCMCFDALPVTWRERKPNVKRACRKRWRLTPATQKLISSLPVFSCPKTEKM